MRVPAIKFSRCKSVLDGEHAAAECAEALASATAASTSSMACGRGTEARAGSPTSSTNCACSATLDRGG
jgi:hypothetical protein